MYVLYKMYKQYIANIHNTHRQEDYKEAITLYNAEVNEDTVKTM